MLTKTTKNSKIEVLHLTAEYLVVQVRTPAYALSQGKE